MRGVRGLSVAALVDAVVVNARTNGIRRDQVERYVVASLRRLVGRVEVKAFEGHEDLLRWLRHAKPDLVFNMTERIDDDPRKDALICALLELHGVAYTGASPRGLMLCRDKAVSKLIAQGEGFRVPDFFVVDGRSGGLPQQIRFPIVVKPRHGDSSDGISGGSFVRSREALARRIALLRRRGVHDIIGEEFIEGRELLVRIVGDRVLPPREVVIGRAGSRAPRLFTSRLKHNLAYRRRWLARVEFAQLAPSAARELRRITRRTAAALGLRDYGRIDVKLAADGGWFFIEANPNPPLAPFRKSFTGSWTEPNFDDLVAEIVKSATGRGQ